MTSTLGVSMQICAAFFLYSITKTFSVNQKCRFPLIKHFLEFFISGNFVIVLKSYFD